MTLCALYLRVSSDQQREKNTIGSQRTILPKVAESHGLEVFKQYEDDGISGESIEARPAFQALLEDASAGHFEAVVVIDFDRLTRATDLTQLALIKRIFREAKIKVITPNQIFDFENEDHDFMSDLFGILAKHEKRKILARTRRGIKEKKRQGKWIMGSPPIPYFRDGDGVVRIDPVKQALVLSILKDTRDLGRPAISQRYGLGQGMLSRMLSRRRLLFYAGYLEVDGEKIRGQWPAICSLEEVGEILGHIEARKKKKQFRGCMHLLTGMGIFICGACGRAVGSHSDSDVRPEKGSKEPRRYYRAYYKCNNRNCALRKKPVPAARIENIVTYTLDNHLKNLNLIAEWTALIESKQRSSTEIQVIDDRISEEERKKKTLLTAISKEVVTFDDAREEMDRIKKTLDELRESRAALIGLSVPATPLAELSELSKLEMDHLDFDTKRRVVAACVQKIVLSEANILIEYRFVINESGENKERIKFDRGK